MLLADFPRGAQGDVKKTMSKGQYLVYERASRNEERLFADTAKEVVDDGIREPKNWWRGQDPKKHPGGRPLPYSFRQMLLILLQKDCSR
jgi:hypothetical protein